MKIKIFPLIHKYQISFSQFSFAYLLTINHRRKLKSIHRVQIDEIEDILPTTAIIDNAFDYRSVLLWLSLGCLGIFLVLHVIRCVKKSELKKSDLVMVPQQRVEMLSADGEKQRKKIKKLFFIISKKNVLNFNLIFSLLACQFF